MSLPLGATLVSASHQRVDAPFADGAVVMHVNITEKQLAAEQTRLVANALSGERIDDAQFVAVIRDLSTELDYQRRLTHISRHDTLTGLPNRAALAEHTDRAIVDSAGQRGVCALILVSLDHFRPINESLGHAWGDLLLQEMARHLRQIVPPGAR